LKRFVVFAGLFLVVTTGLVNIGIIAVDDYADIISNIIPAGRNSVPQLVSAADFRSAIPTISLSGVADIGKYLGITEPANQLRFVLAFLGLFSLCIQLFFGMKLFRLAWGPNDARETIAAFLLSFYFVCPLFFTRPMIESLGAPFLTVSAYFATVLYKRNTVASCILSVVFLVLSSLFRFQAGVCFAALVLVALFSERRWRNTSLVVATGCFAFVVTGLLDYFLKGQFHSSLISYWKFNSANSSSFGVTPFYTFVLLFFALSFPFLLISRYRGMAWKREYAVLFPCALYFSAFVLVHSFVPHKEERFMVTVFPLFLFLMVPIAHYFWEQKSYVRIVSFLTLNSLLLVLASYSVAQNNVVALGTYLERHSRIRSVLSFKESVVLVPDAFIQRHIDWRMNADSAAVSHLTCDDVVAVRQDLLKDFEPSQSSFRKIGEFHPGLLEALLVKLNPYRNGRRATIELYSPRDCS
jgi:hypothetical protein